MYPNDNYNPYQNSLDSIQKEIQQMRAITSNSQPVTIDQERHTLKVKGRAGAESLKLPPNSDDLVLDMDDPIVWFIQSDGAGYVTATPFDISKHEEITQEDIFKSIDERLSRLEEAMNNGKSDNNSTGAKPTNAAKPGNQNNNAGNRSNDKR